MTAILAVSTPLSLRQHRGAGNGGFNGTLVLPLGAVYFVHVLLQFWMASRRALHISSASCWPMR